MSLFFEQIAEPAYRPDRDARRLELAAQAMHVDLDRVGADFLVPAVELLGELLLVHYAAAAQHQHFQHAELARGQLERLPVERGPPPGGVEGERAVRDHRSSARLPAPDERPHARLQLRQVERLGEVVVRADVESLDAVFERVARGEHHHRDARTAPAQAPQDLEPVELGQAEIENHEVVVLRGQHVVRLVAVPRAVHRVVGRAQRARQAIGQDRIVFDYEDAHVIPDAGLAVFISTTTSGVSRN